MRREIGPSREFGLADVRRTIANAELTVTRYQGAVAEAERESGLTAAFLDYNDSLLAALQTEPPPLAVDVLPIEVRPQPVTRKERFLAKISQPRPETIQFEAFYPTTHDFYAYYSSNYDNPAMVDLVYPAPLLRPDQMRARLSLEPERDEIGELPRFSPPLYGLERKPLFERGSDNTFATIVTVAEGEFHLTPERMEKAIDNLEGYVAETEGEVPALPEKERYTGERENVERKLADEKQTIGNRMSEELRLVTVALKAAEKNKFVRLPGRIRFPSQDPRTSYEFDISDGRLYAVIHSQLDNGEELKPRSGRPARVSASHDDYIAVTPALLRYFRNLLR